MDQHGPDAANRRKRFEAVAHGILPRRAAHDRRGEGKLPDRLRVQALLAGADHDTDLIDARVPETLDGVPDERLAGELRILFGRLSAGAAAVPRRHDQSDDPALDPHGRPLAEPDLARQRL